VTPVRSAAGTERRDGEIRTAGRRSEPDRRHGTYSRGGLPKLPNVHSDEGALKRPSRASKVRKVCTHKARLRDETIITMRMSHWLDGTGGGL